MKRLRILVLMHEDLVPPDAPSTGQDVTSAEWKTEYDVVSTLRKLGHDVKPLGVKSDLGVLRIGHRRLETAHRLQSARRVRWGGGIRPERRVVSGTAARAVHRL